ASPNRYTPQHHDRRCPGPNHGETRAGACPPRCQVVAGRKSSGLLLSRRLTRDQGGAVYLGKRFHYQYLKAEPSRRLRLACISCELAVASLPVIAVAQWRDRMESLNVRLPALRYQRTRAQAHR